VAFERKSPPFAGKREGWGTLKYVVGGRKGGNPRAKRRGLGVEEFKALVRSGVVTEGLLDWTPSKARIPVAGEGAGCIFNSIKDGKIKISE
jgi:hypothetical protein